MTTRPIFVLGNPRSGTTLLRLLISSHENIAIPPECGFALWLRQEYSHWSSIASKNAQAIDDFILSLKRCRKFETWQLPEKCIRQQILNRNPCNYTELVEAVYDAYRQLFKPIATRWGDKNNFHVKHVDEIVELFPACQLIHIVRDVRDVACSYKELKHLDSQSPYRPNLPCQLEAIAHDWSENVLAVQSSVQKLDCDTSLTIRYEDLVREPQKVLVHICEFLDEEFEMAMLNFFKNNLEPAQTIDWKQKTKSPISDDRVERYRRDLSRSDILFLTDKCRQELLRFGYSLQ